MAKRKSKKQELTDEEINNLSHQDFVLWFIEYNNRVINKHINKRMIPNRYDPDDIKSYIIERILDILQKRELKNKAIKEPRLYFRKLIDYYCIEYQRMNGFIYSMPKRPRCPDAEKEISKYGFFYLVTQDSNDSDDNSAPVDSLTELSYIDANLCLNSDAETVYQVKGIDSSEKNEHWNKLMHMVLPEDRKVLECLFEKNMNVTETSKYLGIAVCTTYSRKKRALKAISGTLATYIDLDQDIWKIFSNLSDLEDEKIDIGNFYIIKEEDQDLSPDPLN